MPRKKGTKKGQTNISNVDVLPGESTPKTAWSKASEESALRSGNSKLDRALSPGALSLDASSRPSSRADTISVASSQKKSPLEKLLDLAGAKKDPKYQTRKFYEGRGFLSHTNLRDDNHAVNLFNGFKKDEDFQKTLKALFDTSSKIPPNLTIASLDVINQQLIESRLALIDATAGKKLKQLEDIHKKNSQIVSAETIQGFKDQIKKEKDAAQKALEEELKALKSQDDLEGHLNHGAILGEAQEKEINRYLFEAIFRIFIDQCNIDQKPQDHIRFNNNIKRLSNNLSYQTYHCQKYQQKQLAAENELEKFKADIYLRNEMLRIAYDGEQGINLLNPFLQFCQFYGLDTVPREMTQDLAHKIETDIRFAGSVANMIETDSQKFYDQVLSTVSTKNQHIKTIDGKKYLQFTFVTPDSVEFVFVMVNKEKEPQHDDKGNILMEHIRSGHRKTTFKPRGAKKKVRDRLESTMTNTRQVADNDKVEGWKDFNHFIKICNDQGMNETLVKAQGKLKARQTGNFQVAEGSDQDDVKNLILFSAQKTVYAMSIFGDCMHHWGSGQEIGANSQFGGSDNVIGFPILVENRVHGAGFSKQNGFFNAGIESSSTSVIVLTDKNGNHERFETNDRVLANLERMGFDDIRARVNKVKKEGRYTSDMIKDSRHSVPHIISSNKKDLVSDLILFYDKISKYLDFYNRYQGARGTKINILSQNAETIIQKDPQEFISPSLQQSIVEFKSQVEDLFPKGKKTALGKEDIIKAINEDKTGSKITDFKGIINRLSQNIVTNGNSKIMNDFITGPIAYMQLVDQFCEDKVKLEKTGKKDKKPNNFNDLVEQIAKGKGDKVAILSDDSVKYNIARVICATAHKSLAPEHQETFIKALPRFGTNADQKPLGYEILASGRLGSYQKVLKMGPESLSQIQDMVKTTLQNLSLDSQKNLQVNTLKALQVNNREKAFDKSTISIRSEEKKFDHKQKTEPSVSVLNDELSKQDEVSITPFETSERRDSKHSKIAPAPETPKSSVKQNVSVSQVNSNKSKEPGHSQSQ